MVFLIYALLAKATDVAANPPAEQLPATAASTGTQGVILHKPSIELLEFIGEFGDENTETLDAMGIGNAGKIAEQSKPAQNKSGRNRKNDNELDSADYTH